MSHQAAEAEANREARAKVIAAEGEQKAARALKEASDVLDESPAALQLRYLETLHDIAREKNSTILFPLPIEMLRPWSRAGRESKVSGHFVQQTAISEEPSNQPSSF